MIRTLMSALAAVMIGLSTAPAVAGDVHFGVTIGGPIGAGAGHGVFGFGYGYPEPVPVVRARPREVCEEVWRTRRQRDAWGRVIRVVKVRDVVCYPAWR